MFSMCDFLLHFQHQSWMRKLGMSVRSNILSVGKSCILARRFKLFAFQYVSQKYVKMSLWATE